MMRSTARVAVIGLALGLVAPTLQAQPPGYYGPPPVRQQAEGPAAILSEGIGKVTAFLSQGGSRDPDAVEAFVRSEVAPYFDFAYMARFVAGPRYRYMSADERKQMEKALVGMFLGAMAEKLSGYPYGHVRYLPQRRDPRSGEVVLGIQAYQPNGLMTQLDFRLYRSPQGWKVFDVKANGQSALVYYRQYFSRSAQRQGRPQRY